MHGPLARKQTSRETDSYTETNKPTHRQTDLSVTDCKPTPLLT